MARLITSGCSCTQYCWPTWADYLGRSYGGYINVGLPGADNAVIARNVMMVVKPGDTVVVQWTGFDRFNNFKENRPQDDKEYGDQLVIKWSCLDVLDRGGWHHSGGQGGSKEFLVNHYHRIERFRHTLDYVKMLEMHSKITGYRLWNFNMTNWFLGECEREIDERLVQMHELANFDHFYTKENLESVKVRVADLTVKHKYNTISDTHPTPWAHWVWLRDYMAPEIGVKLAPFLEQQANLDQERVLNGDID